MIRRTMITAVSFILLGLTIAVAPQKAEARRYRRRYLRVRYRGRLPYIRIYINGRYRGKVNRGGQKSFYLRTGRTYRVRARYASRSRTKSVFLPRNARRRYKYVTFRRPTRRGSAYNDGDRPGYRRVRLRVRYFGRRRYARCYINGVYKGKIYRRRSKVFRARVGRRYRIQMRYGSRRRTKSVYISRRQRTTRTVTFRRP